MIIKNLKLLNFRNYSFSDIFFSDGVNVLFGENAQGKTNLLEAVFFLSCLKPFRAKKENEIIKLGEKEVQLSGNFYAYNREINVFCGISLSGRRNLKVNGIPQKKPSEHIGLIRTVLFSPDDLQMIKEGPALRRRFLNIAISQLNPSYIRSLSEHNRLIAHKKSILKESELRSDLVSFLDVLNERLALRMAEITAARADFIKKLNFLAGEKMIVLSGGRETLSFRYICDSAVENPFISVSENSARILSHLSARKKAELESGLCLIGVQRDDFEVFINETEAKQFASQGQIRSAVLAIKLSEHEIQKEESGETPILLLDDVLSELDAKRRDFLINSASDGQIIITGCDAGVLSEMKSGKLFTVKDGNIEEEKEINGGL